MAYPESVCVVTGCERAVQRSERVTYSRCPDHVSAVLTGAFGPIPLDSPSGATALPSPQGVVAPLRSPRGALLVGSRSG
jgi:hypothetical protein